MKTRSTTVLTVRHRGVVAIGGDGQVTLGTSVMKADANKIRRLMDGKVITGFAGSSADAFALPQHLTARLPGPVGTVICGIPLVMLPLERQRQFVAEVERIAPGLGFLLYTYCITSPLPYRKLGLDAVREAWTPRNFPPASVWRYRPLGAAPG